MKILIPERELTPNTFFSDRISGGIELFVKLICANIPNVVPVVITKDDIKNRRTSSIMKEAIIREEPDLIFCNDVNIALLKSVQKFDIPIICVFHIGFERGLNTLSLNGMINKFIERKGHLYFVSENQFNYHNDMHVRTKGSKLMPHKGYVNPSFATDDLCFSDAIFFDAGTIGRIDPIKRPFWLHKNVKDIGLSSCVLTITPPEDSSYYKDYVSNLHWEPPNHTYFDLPRRDVMEKLSTFGCYVSTCSAESWGITAMEAVCSGVPLILVSDKKHSSEDIPHRSNYVFKISSKTSKEDLYDLVKIANSFTISERREIAEENRMKHSREAWVKKIEAMIDMAYSEKRKMKFK